MIEMKYFGKKENSCSKIGGSTCRLQEWLKIIKKRIEQDDATKFRQDLDEHWSSKNNMDLWQDENSFQVFEKWNDKKLSAGSKGNSKSEEEDAKLC
jgi:hypothetical protein